MGSIRQERLETTDESFRLVVVDAGGEPRELDLAVEPGGLRITVFHRTEHALIPVDDAQAREVTRWLADRYGFPPGYTYVPGAGVIDDRTP